MWAEHRAGPVANVYFCPGKLCHISPGYNSDWVVFPDFVILYNGKHLLVFHSDPLISAAREIGLKAQKMRLMMHRGLYKCLVPEDSSNNNIDFPLQLVYADN